MLNPGDKVNASEEDRIEQLSDAEKEREIASIVQQSGRTGKEVEMLTHMLRQFYDNPDWYQRVPGIDGDFRPGSPLPYEG